MFSITPIFFISILSGLIQVMFGLGTPFALQVNVIVCPIQDWVLESAIFCIVAASVNINSPTIQKLEMWMLESHPTKINK